MSAERVWTVFMELAQREDGGKEEAGKEEEEEEEEERGQGEELLEVGWSLLRTEN